ncbi:STAS domain-containing protein [Planobispora rosea]|nr:STAS domain-containing protein [Planobispora rosea]
MTTRHADGHALVTVAGELDITTRPELCARVEHILGTRPGTLVLDLGAVTFIDARGLSALVVLRRHAVEMGTSLLLARVSPPVRSILGMTGLSESFPVSAEAAAVRSAFARPEPGEGGPYGRGDADGDFARSGLPPAAGGHSLES